jgi:large subunit ribosomal protein L23
MELTRVILGPVVTEKSERSKTDRVYTLRVAPAATKVDVAQALSRHFGVEVASVRMVNIRGKVRELGAGRITTRRHASRRAIVTLGAKSKSLDLATFQTK